MTLAPHHLVSAHDWQRVTFTTYALSLSFFEAVILDALIRGGGRQALILADVEGVRASLGEQGAQRVGKDYEVEPVAVSGGVFHPKISVFSGRDDCHLLVGSGNLTFGGWGANFEVLEHLHPSFAADAFADAADFFERLSANDRVRHGARAHCDATAADLRAAIQGKPLTGGIRLLHNLDTSISDQIVAAAGELGGATQLVAAAPFWDAGAAIDRLCAALGLDTVFIHAHAHGTVEGRAGGNWPSACRSVVRPVRLGVMTEADKPRRLHAKAFEITCRQGRIVVSGSANATGAGLDAGCNVEACVMRLQRERSAAWGFIPSEAPDPQPALEAEDEEDRQKCGILRAVLDGDSVHGDVLTPSMSGTVSVSYVSGAGEQALGEARLSADRRFEISAPSLEEMSFLGGRLVIRVVDGKGRAAEGFVSVASFAEVTRRAGIAARRLLALLAGTETPADVAAIMSWLHDNPGALTGSPPQGFGGGTDDADRAEKPSPLVVVADLSGAAVAAAQATGVGGHKSGGTGWSRFMDQILASFRQKRGAFAAAGGEGKSDDDDDDDDNSRKKDTNKQRETQREREAIERSLANFQKLFDVLLKPGQEARQAVTAFDLTLYVCERLRPDRAQAVQWLRHLVKALLEKGVPPERRADAAAAVLTLAGASVEHCGPRWARGYLLRLGIDLAGSPPAGEDVQGLHAVLPQSKTLEELWPQLQAIRTFPEQVRSYVAALDGKAAAGEFPDLPAAAEEEWTLMKEALKPNNGARKVLICEKFPGTCPEHHLSIPTGEVGKLHSIGIATAKNCCRKVLIWTGGS